MLSIQKLTMLLQTRAERPTSWSLILKMQLPIFFSKQCHLLRRQLLLLVVLLLLLLLYKGKGVFFLSFFVITKTTTAVAIKINENKCIINLLLLYSGRTALTRATTDAV